jgi:hypothetical protein
MTHERIPLTELPRKLRDKFGSSPSYRRLYVHVLDGTLPAQQDGARWFVIGRDLDKIGVILGLQPPKPVRPGRKQSAAQAA